MSETPMSKIDTKMFKNKRELNRFLSYTSQFYTHALTFEQAEEAFNNDTAKDIFDVLVGLAKDPSIGFPKEKTNWAKTRRDYRLHWKNVEISVQSCLSQHKKRLESRAS